MAGTQVFPTPTGGGGGGTPASTVVTETTFGAASAVGTSTDYARADHTHGTPPLTPPSDASGAIGTSSLRWGDIVANTHRVFPSAGATNASTSLTSGALKLGAGAATALDTQIIRNATKQIQIDDNAGGAATLVVIGVTRTQARAIQVSALKTTAYNVAAADDVVLVDPTAGAFDVTLPNANVIAGRRIQVKRTTTSANAVTVKSAGGTIDNVPAATGVTLSGGSLNSLTVASDGTNWWII